MFNLYSCHKYLEQSGSQILADIARFRFGDKGATEAISFKIKNFSKMLKSHTNWEEGFVFKTLPFDISIQDELDSHKQLEGELDDIQDNLKSAVSELQVHQCYLQFRKFYAQLLIHLYEEEIKLGKLLEEGGTSEKALRMIDREIYASMSAKDMIGMCSELLPPCNYGEKIAVLEDLWDANHEAFLSAFQGLSGLFSEDEQKTLQEKFK